MSTLQVDSITNAAGSGAPTFPNGITLSNYSEVFVTGGNGFGAVSTFIRRFTTLTTNVGSNVSYADDPNLGGSFTINANGVYTINYIDGSGAAGTVVGLSKNASGGQLTSSIGSISIVNYLSAGDIVPPQYIVVSFTGKLLAGDIIRAHTDTTANETTAQSCNLRIVRVV